MSMSAKLYRNNRKYRNYIEHMKINMMRDGIYTYMILFLICKYVICHYHNTLFIVFIYIYI